jgi:cytochrome P450
LKYTEATILDVQRLGSVAPTGAAHANFEAMKIDGFDVPARSMIIANIYAIHRDPKLWKKPLDLCPEHFLDDSGNVFIPKGFLPFGIGNQHLSVIYFYEQDCHLKGLGATNYCLSVYKMEATF